MIAEFFEDCEIFITGGSGVVGKAVIELLLRACNVKRIYVLLRPKKNLSIEERFEKISKSLLFRRLRELKPNELDKVYPVPGDVLLPNLGITPEYAKLMENVAIVYHCAATVRFDEPLRVALRLNVAGTMKALNFAETLKHLKIFMHVSTYYSNPHMPFIEPKLYPSPMDWKLCLKLLENDISDEMLSAITKKLIVGFPNTYTFTKNLAESLVNEYRDRLPIGIFKPSIVVFALRDPEPGYPPSLMGAMGLFTVAGLGILKIVYIGTGVRLDLSPQDICVKLMLYDTYSAAKIHSQGKPENIPVYLCSTQAHQSNGFREIGEMMNTENLWTEVAFEKCFMIPQCNYTSSPTAYWFLVMLKQVLPAMLGDGFLRLLGYKPALMSVVRKAYVALHEMRAFLSNNFDSAGVTDYDNALETLKTDDNFDITVDVNREWNMNDLRMCCLNMVHGIREVLLKENPATIKKHQKIMKIKIFTYNVIRGYLLYYALRKIYRMGWNYYENNLEMNL